MCILLHLIISEILERHCCWFISNLHSWKNVFSDQESGVKEYGVAMCTRPAYTDVSDYVLTGQQCLGVDTSNNVEDGHSYYVSVKVFI